MILDHRQIKTPFPSTTDQSALSSPPPMVRRFGEVYPSELSHSWQLILFSNTRHRMEDEVRRAINSGLDRFVDDVLAMSSYCLMNLL